jgi:hypothetical protein
MSAAEVCLEGDSIEADGHRSIELASQDTIGFFEAFEFAGGNVAAFDDGARGEQLGEDLHDLRFALIHAEGGELDDENVFVFVDDEAAQEVALGVDEAKAGGLGKVFLAEGVGLANAFAKEFGADLDSFAGEKADANFGFGVPKADANEALAVVLHLHQRTVVDVSSGAEE